MDYWNGSSEIDKAIKFVNQLKPHEAAPRFLCLLTETYPMWYLTGTNGPALEIFQHLNQIAQLIPHLQAPPGKKPLKL